MKTLNGFCFLGMAVLANANVYAADIYKWVDSSGGVHYSDTPREGAQKVEIPGIQTFTPPPSNTGSNAPASDEQTVASASSEKGYKSISIIQPSNQATIRNNQGYVLINAEIEPELKEGDLLQIIFDGNPFGKPQSNPSFALSNINRGTHTISVQVLDKDGNMIITSTPIQFFMQRPRVNMGGV